jgi:hypothetical protein
VRKHLAWASALLALCLAACSGTATGAPAATPGAPTCVNSQTAHRAYVVVQHLSGASLQRCVGFDGAQINGDDLMRESGLEYQTQSFTGLGKAVCQVDNEPAQFSECFPKDKPFWAIFVSTGGAAWAEAQTGYASINLKDGDAIAWQYRAQNASPAPPPLPRK